MTENGIGQSPLRREDKRLLLGQAQFVDDIHLDHMLHGAFVRSPHPHARIVGIDATAAVAAGAALVLTAADLPFNERPWVTRYWHDSIRGGMPRFLASDRVRFVGDPVAFVVARNRYEAEDLAELVRVEYELLPSLATMEEAMAPGAPLLHPGWAGNVAAQYRHLTGDAGVAMQAASQRVRRSFRFSRQLPLAMETRGIVAHFDVDRQALTCWMSTQAHYNVRQNLSTILEVPEYQVQVIATDVGGGFGAKSRTFAEELVVSHASRRLRRPLKWIEDRRENLVATTHSRAIDVDLEFGSDEDGRLAAMIAHVKLDLGGYVFTSGVMTAEVCSNKLTNLYRIPNVLVEVSCIGTNKTPIATYRGAGQPEAVFPVECLMDVLGKTLGLGSEEIRLRNLIQPSDFPYDLDRSLAGAALSFESGDFPDLLSHAVRESGYHEDITVTEAGETEAWGLATGLEGSGLVNYESADIRIDAAGSVTIHSGMTTQGQGQITTFAQVCADSLGVPFDRIRVVMGDTHLVPYGKGAFASRGAVVGANAVHVAALKLKDKVLKLAATLLQSEPQDLDLVEGRIMRPDGSDSGLEVADIARAVAPGAALFDGETSLGVSLVHKNEHPVTMGSSVHVARVRLDRRTGFFRVIDYLVAHDAGRELNPMVVEGQIIGGAVDGIGGALFSEMAYGADGKVLAGQLADYLVATAPEMPSVRLTSKITIPGSNLLGVRGIGEGGIIPVAAAIANALARAIGGNATGHEDPLSVVPFTPERVLRAVKLAEQQGSLAPIEA